ncbi:MAG TPA: hypothetical protein EYP59_18885 [Thiotrichaceae bacterium]|nr:hypothetical protein [Thiotrichaceae bacterium]
MQIQQFKVTLLEDVVTSKRAANEGGHESLDYLPGITFLGAVAAHLYPKLSDADAYTLFHSGKVRFGDALPLSESGQLSYPMPLCWYKDKREEWGPKMGLLNYQHEEYEEYDESIQEEQVRGNYLSFQYDSKNDDRFTKIVPKLRMKTAINPNTGTAKDEQLFGYTSLPVGQQFVFNLESDFADDDDRGKALFKQVVETLQQADLKLGRSRSAEYGAVKIELLPEPKNERPAIQEFSQAITLWLLSDAALQDEQGQPILFQPTAKSVGLPTHFVFDPSKSFLGSRRYAPFNAYRQRRELERTVLSMGSVLHFICQDEEQTVDAETLQHIQTEGIGLYRQAGLGRVWINPPILTAENPRNYFSQISSRLRKKPKVLQAPEEDLIYRYLAKRTQQFSDSDSIEDRLKKWEKERVELYQSARSLSYTPIGVCPGPTPTQWGQVMEIAKTASTVDELTSKLFEAHGVCKADDPQWTKRIYIKDKSDIDDFRKWLRDEKIGNETKQDLLPQIVARFAHLARDVARDQSTGQ